MAPGLFSIIYFQIYTSKIPKISRCNLFTFILLYVLEIFYIYLYQISLLLMTVKGLTTPFSRCMEVFVSLWRCIYWGLDCASYWIDTLVLNWGKYLSLLCCITLSSWRKKSTQAQEVACTKWNESGRLHNFCLLRSSLYGLFSLCRKLLIMWFICNSFASPRWRRHYTSKPKIRYLPCIIVGTSWMTKANGVI